MAASSASQDALALLAADHRAVEDMFEAYEDLDDPTEKQELVGRICRALLVHTLIEEEIFYPTLRGEIDDDDDLDEALVEHDGAKVLIAELLRSEPNHAFYDAKVRVLAEEIRHHVREEEHEAEGLFAQARETGLALDALGEDMQKRKAELERQFAQSGPAMPVTRTFVGAELELGAPVEI